jgi:peptide/nickel transport system substrate-binding protein
MLLIRRFLLTALLASSAMPAALQAETPRDTFVMAMAIDAINTLDPGRLGEAVGDEVVNNICDAVVALDTSTDAKVVPGLAESWSVSEDGMQITFKLRDARHPSGNPVTAPDAVWTFNRTLAINTINAGTLREYGLGADRAAEAFTAPDDRTLVVKLNKPYPTNFILANIFATRAAFILDRQEMAKNYKAAEDPFMKGDEKSPGWLNSNSACAGAYKLRSWTFNDSIVLERNDNYWRGAPTMRRVVIKQLQEPGAQFLQLKGGDLDAARNLNPEGIEGVLADKNLKLVSALRQTMHYATFNTLDKAFADPRVRLAFRYLVDYEALAKTVMRHEGIARASLVPLEAFGALDEKEGQPFKLDLAKAKQLITEAGFPNGFKKEFLFPPNFPNPEVAQHIQANAAKIGIELSLQAMAGAQLFPKMRQRGFEMAMLNWNVVPADGHAFVSRQAMNPDNSPNLPPSNMASWWSAYFDPWVNQTGEKALFERDEAKRAALYHEIQRHQMQNGPNVFMFQIKRNVGMRVAVKEFKFTGNRAYYRTVVK